MQVNKKLQMALRRHQCKQVLTEYMHELSQALGRGQNTIRLLDLEQTDTLEEMLEAKRKACLSASMICFQETWSNEEVNSLRQLILSLRGRLPAIEMVLFTSKSEYCGAVQTSSSEILERAFYLISLDQDELVAFSEDASTGIILSYDTDKHETGNEEVYELLVWGDAWLEALADELKNQINR